MQAVSSIRNFNCRTTYAIETVNAIDVAAIDRFFDNLPVDPYLEGGYRFRRFSRVEVAGNRLRQMPHGYFFQSSDYNPLLGDVVREYPELETDLIELKDFQKLVREFHEFARLCSDANEIGIHQIRTVATSDRIAHPAPPIESTPSVPCNRTSGDR